MMTRRDFEALADALAYLRPEREVEPEGFAVWTDVVYAVGSVCYASNGRFDRGRFERACRTRYAPEAEGAPMP